MEFIKNIKNLSFIQDSNLNQGNHQVYKKQQVKTNLLERLPASAKLNTQVKDRLIYGAGTSKERWLEWEELKNLTLLNFEKDFSAHHRIVIIAPHPDDEILGCAGLIQYWTNLNRKILLIAVTNGTQSHPLSTKYTPEQLNELRPKESICALNILGVHSFVKRIEVNILDGQVYLQQHRLKEALNELIDQNDILISTYEKDGHPDHEATGKIVKYFAQDNQLPCYQMLIWFWHWAIPSKMIIDFRNTYKLPLTPTQLQLKKMAIESFKTQIEDDKSSGNSAILSSETIDRILFPWEIFIYVR